MKKPRRGAFFFACPDSTGIPRHPASLIPRCILMAYAIGATSNHAKSGNFSPQKAVSSHRKSGKFLVKIPPFPTIEKKSNLSKNRRMEETSAKSKLVTQKGLAAILGVSVPTVRRWKGCPVVKISANRHRYDPDDVMAWMKAAVRPIEAQKEEH